MSSLMASPSSLSSRNWSYNVFASFHGPDVRKTLLSHMREQFNRNGITMFNDQEIERSEEIAPSLTEAIRQSRISIVILSKKYASSSWCLDELVEIFECKKKIGQIVMTIFYGVDPSDVRNQTGEFGIAFDATCARKTDEEARLKWSKALKDVGKIAGEDFYRWDSEAKMIGKIAKNVLDKLNVTPSRDFDDMVGLEAHLKEIECLLDLDYGGVKMVAVSGPAGIGKTTIARALHSRLSYRFQLTCFVDNLRGNYHSGFDEYGLKLSLQEQFLSKILNQDGLRISHLGAIKERLCDHRVLIILDDVNNIKQLQALANETTWFGHGSRIVVTTENKELLQQHGINNTYHVGFPSDKQALKILCRYAFKQNYPHNDYEKLSNRVTWLCGNLPLGLCVVGSSLCGKNGDEWDEVIRRLETILDHRDIEEVLRVGYESLHESEQTLFLHIAVFFNNKDVDLVRTMLADGDLDVKHGLKILVNRSLIQTDNFGSILMHKLLQQVGKQAIYRQEPWRRRILIDAREICDVLENDKGSGAISGISFDISNIDEVFILKRAFKRMSNLRFLKIYKSKGYRNDVVHIPEKIEFPRRLRLLDWEAYPNKCLPPTFRLEHLVELDLKNSQLEYLWQGTQNLTNLKKMNLDGSKNLEELPDLSKATSLETLHLDYCSSLVEIPSSFSHLQKLKVLWMPGCISLEVVPAHLNLASLEYVNMNGCPLKNIPFLSIPIKEKHMSEATVEELSASIRFCSRLGTLMISSCGNPKGLIHLPTNLRTLDLIDSDVEWIPELIHLHQLFSLNLTGCKRLASLPELPSSLEFLEANDCESLQNVFHPLNNSLVSLRFTNCFKLGQQARKTIIQRPSTSKSTFASTFLPGREVPEEFDYRARGNSLTISVHGNYDTVRPCVVLSSNHQTPEEICASLEIQVYRYTLNGDLDHLHRGDLLIRDISSRRTDHLYVFEETIDIDCGEIKFEFSSKYHDFDIIECGAHISTEETSEGRRFVYKPREPTFEVDNETCDHTNGVICDHQEVTRIDCWSWIFPCFHLSHFIRYIGFGKKTTEGREVMT